MCRSRAPARLLAVALGVSFAACSTRSNVPLYVDPARPPLAVSVTTDPPPRADGTVPRNARIVVQLDSYPDPDWVGYGPITLRSGAVSFDADVRIALTKMQVVVTPRSLLAPAAQYSVVVSGLVSLDDRVQEADVVATVVAGLDEGAAWPAPPRPTWNGVVGPLLARCAPACHSPVGALGRMRTPSRMLQLVEADQATPADPWDPVLGVIDVPSVGLAGTTAALMRVQRGDPARSVLLRKLLGGSAAASSTADYPSLRVDGRRMPLSLLDEAAEGSPLPVDDIQAVEDWIAAGAPLD
jgi:hypothetical protein